MNFGMYSALCMGPVLCTTQVIAQVEPAYSSVESHAIISLSDDNGSDESTAMDDQGQSLDGLIAESQVQFSNSNGIYFGAVSGIASFSDASIGSFLASSDFAGTDLGNPDAMGRFGHTFSTQFEYQFVIDGEGEIEIEGTLDNSLPAFESYVRIAVSSEFVLGGGFSGNFFDESILDTQNKGSLPFTRLVPLEADSGSYRLRISLIHSGLGQREQELVLSSLGTLFTISTASSCVADLNGDGALDFFDVSAFLTAYLAMDAVADFNSDGLFSFFDVSLFLQSYLQGCP